MLNVLAQKGAPLTMQDNYRHQPIYYASLQDSQRMLDALTKLGVKKEVSDLGTRMQSILPTNFWVNDVDFHQDSSDFLELHKKELSVEEEYVPSIDDNISGLDDGVGEG